MESNDTYSNADWKVSDGPRGPQGDLQNEYHFKGKKAIRHLLDSRKVKHLGGYSLIARDLDNIRVWIAEIIKLQRTLPASEHIAGKQRRKGDPHTNQIIKGLFVAVLSIYGKLYPPAKGRLVSLDPSIIKDPEKRKIHDNLIAYRHNFASHSGDKLAESCDVVGAVVNVEGSGWASFLACEISQPTGWATTYYEKVDALLVDLLEYAHAKREALFDSVKAEELGDAGMSSIVELYSKAKARTRRP